MTNTPTDQLVDDLQVLDTSDWHTSGVDVRSANTLPPACYTSPSFYSHEKRAIFLREWLCVGRSAQIAAPGDWYTITIAGEPLVVARDRQGAIRVMSSVCQHRGMVVTADHDCPGDTWREPPAERSGSGAHAFRCPYHYWTYDLTGQLIGAPEMTRTWDFDKESVRLRALVVEEWEGFIFANFDPDAAPLTPRLAPLSQLIQSWQIDSMVGPPPTVLTDLPWNWKVMQENSIECYHVDRLHRPLHDAVPSSGYFDTPMVNDTAIVSQVRARHKDYALNPTHKSLFPPIETLTDEERQLSLFALVPPTLLFGVNSDSAFYRLVLPKGPNLIDIVFGYLVPPGYAEDPIFDELVELASTTHLRLNRQDFLVNHAVQVGLGSEFAPRGRYSWQEEPLVQFNRWLVARYDRDDA